MKDLTGVRFGHWTVIHVSTEREGRAIVWHCRCDCGVERGVRGTRLSAGKSRGCGCERLRKITTHGQSRAVGRFGTPTYGIWRSMILRCEARGNASYKYYGARGIKVCERWRNDFKAFLSDMGERPEGHSIERDDSSKGYEPSNCRWATATTQNRHRSTVKMTMERATEARALYASGVPQKEIAQRFGVTASLVSMIVTGRIWKHTAT